MRCLAASAALICLLAGCGHGEKTPDAATASASPAPVAMASAVANASISSPSAPARKVAISNDMIEFDYAYPAAAAAIPALKSYFDSDLASQQHSLEDSARSGKADAKQGGYDYHPLSYSADWKVVTDLPNWLSLSTVIGTYEGGAHPNAAFDAMVWDRTANLKRNPIDLFVSKQKLSAAIRPEFCRQIDAQRAAKRGAPVQHGTDEMFTDCLDPTDSTIILGSSNHHTFDRIGVLVAPYDAGPYAEGTYEVTLPVTPAVLAAVRPEFQSSFALKR